MQYPRARGRAMVAWVFGCPSRRPLDILAWRFRKAHYRHTRVRLRAAVIQSPLTSAEGGASRLSGPPFSGLTVMIGSWCEIAISSKARRSAKGGRGLRAC